MMGRAVPLVVVMAAAMALAACGRKNSPATPDGAFRTIYPADLAPASAHPRMPTYPPVVEEPSAGPAEAPPPGEPAPEGPRPSFQDLKHPQAEGAQQP
jgi:hypothetical protein